MQKAKSHIRQLSDREIFDLREEMHRASMWMRAQLDQRRGAQASSIETSQLIEVEQQVGRKLDAPSL